MPLKHPHRHRIQQRRMLHRLNILYPTIIREMAVLTQRKFLGKMSTSVIPNPIEKRTKPNKRFIE